MNRFAGDHIGLDNLPRAECQPDQRHHGRGENRCNRDDDEHAADRPVRLQHRADQERPDDLAQPAHSHRPADAGRADRGRIEQRRQRDHSGRADPDEEADQPVERRCQNHRCADRAERRGEDGADQECRHQRKRGAEPLQEPPGNGHTDEGAEPVEGHDDGGVRGGHAVLPQQGGHPQHHDRQHAEGEEERHPQEDRGKGTLVAEELLHRRAR